MKTKQLEELVLQSLEHEMGGVKVYPTAIECAVNQDLEKEWAKHLGETTVGRRRTLVLSSLSFASARRPRLVRN